jgi:molecular chaperone DnaK (HSP70)
VPSSRYVVGIDLGTTNSALAYADTGVPEGQDPFVIQPAEVELP